MYYCECELSPLQGRIKDVLGLELFDVADQTFPGLSGQQSNGRTLGGKSKRGDTEYTVTDTLTLAEWQLTRMHA